MTLNGIATMDPLAETTDMTTAIATEIGTEIGTGTDDSQTEIAIETAGNRGTMEGESGRGKETYRR